MREKSVTIPKILFEQMAVFCLEENARTPELLNRIRSGVYEKLDRQVNHELYTKYKTAPTAAQRDRARRQYLENIGINKDFIWGDNNDE